MHYELKIVDVVDVVCFLHKPLTLGKESLLSFLLLNSSFYQEKSNEKIAEFKPTILQLHEKF